MANLARWIPKFSVNDMARLVTTGELPLGILTAFVGAPLFLYLIATGGGRRVH